LAKRSNKYLPEEATLAADAAASSDIFICSAVTATPALGEAGDEGGLKISTALLEEKSSHPKYDNVAIIRKMSVFFIENNLSKYLRYKSSENVAYWPKVRAKQKCRIAVLHLLGKLP
jgi:hypothetical protein